MKATLKRIILTLVAIMIILAASSCYIELPAPPNNNSGAAGGADTSGGEVEEDNEATGGVEFPGSDETDEPDEWQDSSSMASDSVSVRVFLNTPYDLTLCLDDETETEGTIWSSRCDGVCTVDDGVVTGVAPGRTEVIASLGDAVVARFSVTVEFMISSNNGYNIVTDLADDQPVIVGSLYIANRLLDRAIAEHKQAITMDFSEMSKDFTYEDFDLDIELGNHVTLRTAYYESTHYIIRFEITYVDDVANSVTPLTDKNTFISVTSGNAVARYVKSLLNSEKYSVRSDDFNDFPINTDNAGDWEVYNSEELWWAVEHGYRPIFPMANSKAELFYERAKIILREIILEGMTDYEKALAIYEYLIDAVAYDYDAYYSNSDKNNVCYYLEGVFESGRAVCDGKSKAFVLLCGIEGINCLRDYGASRDGGAGHAWNYVEIDGVWYLVDTTAGDANFSLPGGIAAAFGHNIEVTTYPSFLSSLDYHYAEYEYSGIWPDILSDGESASLADTFFDRNISEGCDYLIDNRAEMLEIFTAIIDDGGCNNFTLVFKLSNPDASPFTYIDGVSKRWGVTVSLYTITYGENEVILAVVVPST
jgi:hypothetical protein